MCALPWLWAGKIDLNAVVAFLWYIFSVSLEQKACIIAVSICDRAFPCTWLWVNSCMLLQHRLEET